MLCLSIQADYCQSSEDYLKFESSFMEQTLVQHLHDSAAAQSQSANRAVSALLGQVHSAAAVAATARAQLFPLDMQGNQVLLYSQASGLSLDAAAASLGMAGATIAGGAFKGPGPLEHGAVSASVQGSLGVDGVDGVGIVGGAGNSGGVGAAGKVFMCHCGKTFTHKSMRDRHINMHLDLRPFHCPVCAKKFKMKHHLTEHMKTHTGLKPYDCLGCGKKFMWRDSFMRHRSHCERRRGEGSDGGRRDDGPELISPPQLFTSGGEGAAAAAAGGGRGGGDPSMLSPQHSAGAAAQSPAQASGMFGGLGLVRSVCDEDVCEVGPHDPSVT